MICTSCGYDITDDPDGDNRYRGCDPCGWLMHHSCWIEHLSIGTLPCPLTELRSELDDDDHGNVIGMRGQWQLS